MEWSEDYGSRQRKSGNALWRPYFQSRYVSGMRGSSPKCATAYIISRSKTSKRNPPTVVLVRVRASSMMVETPKSPVDNKLQYDQKYFNNLAFLILKFQVCWIQNDRPTYWNTAIFSKKNVTWFEISVKVTANTKRKNYNKESFLSSSSWIHEQLQKRSNIQYLLMLYSECFIQTYVSNL